MRDELCGKRLDEYDILERLGEGWQCVVYRASREGRGQVALKIAGGWLDADSLARFRSEVFEQSATVYPSIVPILDRGTWNNRPYLTMPLLMGNSLETRRCEPEEAVELMIEIAATVQTIHRRNRWHGNLKPSNILFDAEGRFYVTDVGLGPVVGEEFCGYSLPVLDYLAPEQVRQDSTGVKSFSDVYALGGILYFLLTRCPPAITPMKRWEELQKRFEGLAVASGSRPNGVARDLWAVCLCALEVNPEKRYESPAEFAADLRRFLDGRPVHLHGPLPKTSVRLRYMFLRHPILAASAVIGALLLLAVDAMVIWASWLHGEQLIRDRARENAALAAAQARIVLEVLQDDAERLERIAREPSVQEYATSDTAIFPSLALAPFSRDFALDVLFVENTEGYIRAHWPGPWDESITDTQFEFRDYFKCAAELQRRNSRKACISKVYISDPRGRESELRYAFAVPMYNAAGKWIGVLAAQRNIASRLKDIPIDDFQGSGQVTILLGPVDSLPKGMMKSVKAGCEPSRASERQNSSTVEKPPPGAPLVVVIHEQVQSDRLCKIDPVLSSELQKKFNRSSESGDDFDVTNVLPLEWYDYADPVYRTLGPAGFSPVGNTGYVILVYTPKTFLSRATHVVTGKLKCAITVLNLGLVLLMGAGVSFSWHRRRR